MSFFNHPTKTGVILGWFFVFLFAGVVSALTIRSIWSEEDDPTRGVAIQWYNSSEASLDKISTGFFNNATNLNFYLYTEDMMKNMQLTGALRQTVTFEFFPSRGIQPLVRIDVYFPGIKSDTSMVRPAGDENHEKDDKQHDQILEKSLRESMASEITIGTNHDPVDEPEKTGVRAGLTVDHGRIFYNLSIPLNLFGADRTNMVRFKFYTSEIDKTSLKKVMMEMAGNRRPPNFPGRGGAGDFPGGADGGANGGMGPPSGGMGGPPPGGMGGAPPGGGEEMFKSINLKVTIILARLKNR
jgi:hypothetical protein